MKKIILAIIIISSLALSACTDNNGDVNANSNTIENLGETTTLTIESENYIEDLEESQPLTDDEIDITNSGTYEFSGDYSNITVNVNKDIDEGIVYLVLNNANIISETGTPINIIEAKDVVIVLEGENTITQGEIVTEDTEFPSAALYSKADTVITGEGSLTVNTEYRDGINSRDDLIIENATIVVNSVEDGILGKDLLSISEANITITSGKDGLKASNDEDLDKGNLFISGGDYLINAQNDGISAEQILQIESGNFEIYSGGGFVEVLNEITRGEGSGNTVSATDLLEYSMKGIKSNDIIINGGEFILSSYEDTIHANNNLTINGGTFEIITGDDAFHADFALVINDGNITVTDGYEGLEGSTIDVNGGDITINVLDDAVNASSDEGYVKITGGNIYLQSRGDGIDSNNDLYIEGGTIVIEVDAIYSGGDSELDVSGEFSISGGSITDGNGNEIGLNTQGGFSQQQNSGRPRR